MNVFIPTLFTLAWSLLLILLYRPSATLGYYFELSVCITKHTKQAVKQQHRPCSLFYKHERQVTTKSRSVTSMQQWNQNIEIPTECHTGRSLNNTLNTSLCCQTPQEFTFVPLLYFLRKILIVSRCCRKGSAMIWPAKFHGTLLTLQAHRLVRTHPLITRDTWSLCCVSSLTVYQIFVILNLTRLLIMTGYSNTHIFWTKHSFFPYLPEVGYRSRLRTDLSSPLSAWLTWQTNRQCVKTPNCKGLLRTEFTLASLVVWLYEQC